MNGIERIAAERQRQIDRKGYTPEHDDEHDFSELSQAAAVYARLACLNARQDAGFPYEYDTRIAAALEQYPWGNQLPDTTSDPIRDLEKAGALIAAEIDRLQRLQDSKHDTQKPLVHTSAHGARQRAKAGA